MIEKVLKRLKQFDPEIKFKDTWNQKIIYETDIPDCDFYNKTFYHEIYKVPVNHIIGTYHVSYADLTWLEMLGSLKRFYSSYTKENFLKYMAENRGNYIGLSYSKYGDSFIIAEGNHRTCLAVLSGLQYIETRVTEYIFDKELFDVYTEIKEMGLLSPRFNKNNITGREKCDRLWIVWVNDKDIYLSDQFCLDCFLDLYKSIRLDWKSNLFGHLLSKTSYRENRSDTIFIQTPEEVRELKNDIILHKMGLALDL